MSPSDGRPPLADDPLFLARVSELDNGLNPDEPDDATAGSPAPPAPAAPRPPARQAQQASAGKPAAPVTLPASITAAFDALTVPADPSSPEPSTSAGERGPARPLLALFPPESSAPPLPAAPPPSSAPRVRRPGRPPSSRLPRPAPVPGAPRTDAGGARIQPAPYETFYGLTEKAFALNADPRFFFHSTPHDAASQRLLTAIREREGLVLLTGAPGVGKTTLCRAVVEELDRRTLTSFIADPFVSGEELLTQILVDFGVLSPDEGARGAHGRQELSTALHSFIESSLAPLDASAVVLVDEAQNLPPDALEQVTLLCEAAEASTHLQVILIGQPALNDLLRRAEQKHLHQRVNVRCVLEPLPREEVADYALHRLALAGTGLRVDFDDAARARLYELTGGVPRTLNLLCDRALARGYDASASMITAPIVDAAARDLDLAPPLSVRGRTAQLVIALAVAVFVLIGAATAAWVFRDTVTRSIQRWMVVPEPPRPPARPSP